MNPFKALSNFFYECIYCADILAEMAIKTFFSPTRTRPYSVDIERRLNFSALEVLEGVEYVKLFVKIKRVHITEYKDGCHVKEGETIEDYVLKMLFVNGNGWLELLVLRLYFIKDEDIQLVSVMLWGTLENPWSSLKTRMKLNMQLYGGKTHSGKKLSDDLSSHITEKYRQAFEEVFGCCIGF